MLNTYALFNKYLFIYYVSLKQNLHTYLQKYILCYLASPKCLKDSRQKKPTIFNILKLVNYFHIIYRKLVFED